MIQAAGNIVEQEILGHDLTKSMFDTSVGQLKQAKRLLFIPWSPPTDQNADTLHQSLAVFINQAIKFTIGKGFRSIGKLNRKLYRIYIRFDFSISSDWLWSFWTRTRSYSFVDD